MTERSPTTGPFLPEAAEWPDGIYQFQTDDVILGGPDGNDNWPTQALANRTRWLRQMMEAAETALATHEASRNHPTATTAAKGMVVFSTVAEAIAGLVGDKAVTPEGLHAAVQAAVTALVNSSPAALDTLNELAAALGNDPNFATTITNLLSAKAPKDSPDFTGIPKVPTAAPGTNNSQAASTAFVATALAAFAVPDTSIGKHAILVMAGDLQPTITGGCGYLSRVEAGAGYPEIEYLPFDASVEESAERRLPLPKSWNGGAITAVAIWSHAGGNTPSVAWGFKAAFIGPAAPHATAFGAEVVVTQASASAANKYVTAETTAITPGGVAADAGILALRVTRKVANAADTLDQDARLEALLVMVTTDAATDA